MYNNICIVLIYVQNRDIVIYISVNILELYRLRKRKINMVKNIFIIIFQIFPQSLKFGA